MKEINCDNCQAVNQYISASKSYKCSVCESPLDWRSRVICNNCETENRIYQDEKKTAVCRKCNHKLEWSLDPSTYKPNKIPLKARVAILFLCGLLAVLSIVGLFNGSFVMPYGCSRYGGCASRYYFEGWEMLVPLLAAVMAVIGFFAVVVDHYDNRHNEYIYKLIINFSCYAAVFLYLICIL